MRGIAVFAGARAAARAAGARPAPSLRGFDLQARRASPSRSATSDNLAARLERVGTRVEGARSTARRSPATSRGTPRARGAWSARLARLALLAGGPTPSAAASRRRAGGRPARARHRRRALRLQGPHAGPPRPQGRALRRRVAHRAARHRQRRTRSSTPRARGGAPARARITTLDLRLDSDNLNALFAQFGFGDYVKRGTGEARGHARVAGLPQRVRRSPTSRAPSSSRRARGQFAKIEPGAGKLLGLLSLQSMPRRVTFDFRDVFSDGFAFETHHLRREGRARHPAHRRLRDQRARRPS